MIIDLQRRLAEIGRIRIGQQVPSGNGKTRPAKLETFRLTSPDPTRIQYAAGLYGGTPKQWQAPAGKQWEVVTTATTLQVIVPPSDMAFSQYYEMWSAGGCQRRCDGRSESISDGPCLCDPDDRDCDIHSRLSVLLADLPGLGVWRIDTSGYYAAVELQGAVEIIRIAAGRGQMLPARLRLEQRAVKRPGEDGKPVTRRFAVPVLDIEMSPGQLIGGARPTLSPDESRHVDNAAPLALPPASLTPVPASVPTHPARSIVEQMQQPPPPTRSRANAAQPIPATGVEPRKAAAAARDAKPTPQPEPETVSGLDEFAPVELISRGQSAKMHLLFNGMGITKEERAERLAITTQVIGRAVTSSTELTKAEAGKLINHLQNLAEPFPDEPSLDDA